MKTVVAQSVAATHTVHSALTNRAYFSASQRLTSSMPRFSKRVHYPSTRLQVRAEDKNDPRAKEDMIELLERRSGAGGGRSKQGGGTNEQKANRKYSEAEARNRQRREAEGAYFASPADAVGNPAAKKAKSPLPFGLELEPDEFKKPANFDEMGNLQKSWTMWSGEGGILPNMNKLATTAAVVMGFLWIVFRFVGPLLGIYELEESFNSGPNIGI